MSAWKRTNKGNLRISLQIFRLSSLYWIEKTSRRALPVFGGNLAWGRDFKVGRQTLSVLASGGMSNDMQTMNDAEFRLLEATGIVTDEYGYDSYESELKMAALASLDRKSVA